MLTDLRGEPQTLVKVEKEDRLLKSRKCDKQRQEKGGMKNDRGLRRVKGVLENRCQAKGVIVSGKQFVLCLLIVCSLFHI